MTDTTVDAAIPYDGLSLDEHGAHRVTLLASYRLDESWTRVPPPEPTDDDPAPADPQHWRQSWSVSGAPNAPTARLFVIELLVLGNPDLGPFIVGSGCVGPNGDNDDPLGVTA